MSPDVFEAFAAISRHYWRKPPTSVLELGTGGWPLLENLQYMAARCIPLNLTLGNRLPFKTGSLDCILSSSVLEHDKFFWRTLSEVRRVLRPGGLFIVGVPTYMMLPTDIKDTTLAFQRHGLAYGARFSPIFPTKRAGSPTTRRLTGNPRDGIPKISESLHGLCGQQDHWLT